MKKRIRILTIIAALVSLNIFCFNINVFAVDEDEIEVYDNSEEDDDFPEIIEDDETIDTETDDVVNQENPDDDDSDEDSSDDDDSDIDDSDIDDSDIDDYEPDIIETEDDIENEDEPQDFIGTTDAETEATTTIIITTTTTASTTVATTTAAATTQAPVITTTSTVTVEETLPETTVETEIVERVTDTTEETSIVAGIITEDEMNISGTVETSENEGFLEMPEEVADENFSSLIIGIVIAVVIVSAGVAAPFVYIYFKKKRIYQY